MVDPDNEPSESETGMPKKQKMTLGLALAALLGGSKKTPKLPKGGKHRKGGR